MGQKALEQRKRRLLYALPNRDHGPAWSRHDLLCQNLLQILLIPLCSPVIAIDLILRPEIRRQLFTELLRLADPIDSTQLRRKLDRGKRSHQGIERRSVHPACQIELTR